MSYRAYHDYDDDRDVITCVTLSDTRPGLLCTGDPMAGTVPVDYVIGKVRF